MEIFFVTHEDAIFSFLSFLTTFIPVLLSVAFLTLIERKVMGSMQNRRGPNVVGLFGILQPIADGIKLILKEPVIPHKSERIAFFVAPLLTFMLSIINWSTVPLSVKSALLNLNLAVLFFLAVASLSVYGVILAGWSSNSKYSFIGGLRSAAQMISYEISLSLTVIPVIVLCNSLNFVVIVNKQFYCWFIFILFPSAIGFLISMLAETNRTPFDLPEAEGELVAGFNVEYSAFAFALFFLAEYTAMILMSIFFVLFFLGGWWLPYLYIFESFYSNPLIVLIKASFVMHFFVWVRASLPRYRYDQLMQIGWKVLLPAMSGYVIFVCGIVFLARGF
jgi:NADH-quinone oxidoreductase subunit H